MKTVYTVRTNHVGILGVYTSKKQVHEKLKREFNTDSLTIDYINTSKYSYQTLCRYLRNQYVTTIEAKKTDVYIKTIITVEKFNVNQ